MIASGRANPLLMVENLHAFLPTPKGFAHAVDGISFILEPGRTLGLVGESGCGKTMTAYSVMSLLPRNAVVAKESAIEFRGQNLVGLPGAQLRRILGKDIAMIFQDAAAYLNPVRKIGKTISEPLRTIDR
jgi:ABC-type dipeptide/oligopeptide/nickel transport system ATPase component